MLAPIQWRAPMIGAVLCALAAAARATLYDVVSLDTSGFTGGVAYGVSQGQAVGDISGAGGVLWTTPTTPIHLTPPGYAGSVISGIWGNQQVGWVPAPPTANGQKQAALWTGSASSFVNLNGNAPGQSWADATDGAQQVGFSESGTSGAALWSGTAASYVDLSPPGTSYGYSEATSVWNGVQVGWGGADSGSNVADALLWNGTASSYTVLKTGAKAFGVSRGQVVGWAGIGGTNVASLWTSYSPSSFVNLAPRGTTASELLSTNGVQQVGDVSFQPGINGLLPLDHHAAVWNGTAGSYQLLPSPASASMAYGIDGNGDIVGGYGAGTPVLWIPHRFPGDANFDGTVDFTDLVVLARHYGQAGEWVDGDFDGDGTINFNDLVILARNYGQSQPAITSVPEPTIPAIILATSMSLLLRRR